MIRFHLHSYGEFNAARRIGPTVWPHFDLLFIHEGRVSIRLGSAADEVELTSGQCILIFPHTPFRGYSLTPSTRASVQHFGIDRRTAVRPPFDRLAHRRDGFSVYGDAAGRAVENDVHRAMRLAGADNASPLVREMRIANLTLIQSVLSDPPLQSTPNTTGGAFEAVIRWAQDNLHYGPTVDDLARCAGLSCSHFRSRFAQSYGRSAGSFLLDLRLREASRLLRETRMPIKQIARRTGYGDVANFHRAFQRGNSLTPGRYRERHAPAG